MLFSLCANSDLTQTNSWCLLYSPIIIYKVLGAKIYGRAEDRIRECTTNPVAKLAVPWQTDFIHPLLMIMGQQFVR